MRRTLARGLLLGGFFLGATASMLPAVATPANTKVAGVFQLPCRQDTCDPAQDHTIADAGVAHDVTQIQVSSSSSVGLDWVALQAQLGSGAWTCVKYWELNSPTSFNANFNWDTSIWPGQCPQAPSPSLTRNGVYSLRVVAKEAVSGDTQVSSERTLKVNNLPVAPVWDAGLTVSGAEDRQPTVELRFHGGQEPDIIEYHFVRLSPDGTETEYIVSAAKPGGQGCERSGTTYVCTDDDFPSQGFAGTYSYVLLAFRSSPVSGVTCMLSPKPACIGSATSAAQSVQIEEPAADTTSGGSGSGTTPDLTPKTTKHPGRITHATKGHRVASGDHATYCDFFCGTLKKTLPYGSQRYFSPGDPASTAAPNIVAAGARAESVLDNHALWRSVAGGLLLLLAAMHVMRVTRRT